MKKTIYLADLMHSNFGLAYTTTPLGVGKIGTHILHKFGGDNVEVRLFRAFEDIEEAVKEKQPDLVGLSSYAWNENLTAATFRYLKKTCPDAVLVTGGANISVFGWEHNYLSKDKDKMTTMFSKSLDAETFRIMPNVDYLVHGHGEYPVANIVERLLGGSSNADVKGQSIDGCTGFFEGKVTIGATPPFPLDLDEFPSPYTTGLLDEMIQKYRLPAQLETNRGCPYQCSFCTTGGAYNKIAKHSTDYFMEELHWANDNLENRMLRLSDSNFGLFERDVETADRIKKMQIKSGYPVAVRVYYSTIRANERTLKITKLLNRYQPFTISLQSNTPLVLENVQRRNNPKIEELKKMVDFAHTNGLSVATDLIAGMPGETYESFKETTAKVIRTGFDSIYVNQLFLLKGSDLYTRYARGKFNYRTMFAMMAYSVTKVDGQYVIEGEEYPVGERGESTEGFWKFYKFSIFIYIIYGGGYFKELIMHFDNYGVSFLDAYELILAQPSEYPNYNCVLDEATCNAQEHKIFDTMDELSQKVKNAIKSDDDNKNGSIFQGMNIFSHIIHKMGDILKHENRRKIIDEFVKASYVIAGQNDVFDKEFRDITDELAGLTMDIMVSPLGAKEPSIMKETNFDIIAWMQNDYRGKLTEYRLPQKGHVFLTLRNFNEHQHLVDNSEGLSDDDVYRRYYAQINSSNMRRWFTKTENWTTEVEQGPTALTRLVDQTQPQATEMGLLR